MSRKFLIPLEIREQPSPSNPVSGFLSVFAKATGGLFWRNSSGTERQIATTNDLSNNIYNWVVSGGNPTAPGSSLTMSIPSATAVIQGRVTNWTTANYTYPINKYIFTDLKSDGTLSHTAIDPGAQIPLPASDAVRLCHVTTNDSQIVSVVDLRRLEPVNREIAEGGFTPQSLLNDLKVTSGTYTGAWRQAPSGKINWYFANIALYLFYPSYVTASEVKTYLNLYISKLESNKAIMDIASDLTTKVAQDSDDAYAGTFLRLVAKYVRTSRDFAWFTTNYNTIKDIAYNNLVLQQKPSGLIKTFQAPNPYDVGFLMDNCEVYSGLKEYVDLLTLTGNTTDATYYAGVRDGVATGVYSLYDVPNNRWIASDASSAGTNWYADLTCQIFPELHDVPNATKYLKWDRGWEYLQTYAPAWWQTKVDAFPWMIVAYFAGAKRRDWLKANKMLNWSKKYFIPQLGLYTIDNLAWSYALMNYYNDLKYEPQLLQDSLLLQNSLDNTKQVQFELGSIGTATTRTITLPNKSGTMAMLSDITGGGAGLRTTSFSIASGSNAASQQAFYHRTYNRDAFTANKIYFYVDVLSGTPTVECGIYDNAGTTRLAQGTVVVNTTGLWSITLSSPVSLTANTLYWVSLVNRTSDVTTAFKRQSAGDSNITHNKVQGSTTSLPTTIPAGSATAVIFWLEVTA